MGPRVRHLASAMSSMSLGTWCRLRYSPTVILQFSSVYSMEPMSARSSFVRLRPASGAKNTGSEAQLWRSATRIKGRSSRD